MSPAVAAASLLGQIVGLLHSVEYFSLLSKCTVVVTVSDLHKLDEAVKWEILVLIIVYNVRCK